MMHSIARDRNFVHVLSPHSASRLCRTGHPNRLSGEKNACHPIAAPVHHREGSQGRTAANRSEALPRRRPAARRQSTWLTKYSPLLARCPGVVTTGEALHPLTVERLAPQLLGSEASAPLPLADYIQPMSEVSSRSWNRAAEREPIAALRLTLCENQPATPGAPDNSSLSHFSAMMRPCWLRRAARNRHRHAIEQVSRRWRGGRRGDSGTSPP